MLPPLVTYCPSDIYTSAQSNVAEVPVVWRQPIVEDNYGRVMLVSTSHSPGEYFSIGSTLVTYTFVDDSYNEIKCRFNVTVDIGKI